MTALCELGVMAKYWKPGRVKTRLAAAIGPGPAANIYVAMLRHTVERFSAVADRRTIVFTPRERRDSFAAVAGECWSLVPQGSGDLGARMARFFRRGFRQGADRVVLIGADSPTVPCEHVQRAFELLAERPVVLGPARDGGYYLVGAAGGIPPIFTGIEWSTARVWQQTISVLEKTRIAYHTLPAWYDIDTVEDLASAQQDGFQIRG